MAYVGSTTVLGNGETWTSGAMAADRADAVNGAVFADEGGDIYIEQSSDGTNWDISTTYTVTADDGKGFSESLYLPYWRIRYVNGGSDQTAFRISARTGSAGDS